MSDKLLSPQTDPTYRAGYQAGWTNSPIDPDLFRETAYRSGLQHGRAARVDRADWTRLTGSGQQRHAWTTTSSDPSPSGLGIVRECACGASTVAVIPEPAHHVPWADREAKHLREAAAIADGSVWHGVPAVHSYRLLIRRRRHTPNPDEIVVSALWPDGFRDVLTWTADTAGIAHAQAWCDQHPTSWLERRDHSPIGPNDLARCFPMTAQPATVEESTREHRPAG